MITHYALVPDIRLQLSLGPHVACADVQVQPTAEGARNFSQCDSMLIGDTAGANTYPYIQVRPFIQF